MRFSDTLSTPSWITFQLLEQCNLRCRMCYEWGDTGSYHRREKPASLELPVVLRTIEECVPTRPIFEFFGGEPLLYPGIWDVIRVIRHAGCNLAFSTNGTLLEDRAEQLVDDAPTRLWISLDGPESINDQQRGAGVFQRALRGMEELVRIKRGKGSVLPQIGVTCVVTPFNYEHIEKLFSADLDVSMISAVSLELQSYATAEQVRRYSEILRDEFGMTSTSCAEGYVRDPAIFASIDCELLARSMTTIREMCAARGMDFYSQPKTLEANNIRNYFSANWSAMRDRRSRCAVPWLAAEISARGDVATCHSFYDLPVGNIYEQSLLEIWRGSRLKKVQGYLRDKLFPICTACCRYYND